MRALNGLFLFAFLLAGCYGETKCPPFSEEENGWLPYHKNQRLRFTNGTDTLVIQTVEGGFSRGYSKSRYCGCYCESGSEFKARSNSVFPLQIDGSVYVLENAMFIGLDFYSNDSVSSSLRDLGSFNVQAEYNRLFGADTAEPMMGYQDVMKLEMDTSYYHYRIWQVFLAKSKGIIRFQHSEQSEPWNLIDVISY
jgi:hypothetical protein